MKSHYPNCQLGDQCKCDEIDELPDDYEVSQSREDAEADICCSSLSHKDTCSANPPKSERQIIEEAQRERLHEGLISLSRWCIERAWGKGNMETTLTMLEKKAAGIRGKCMKSGWRAIAEHSQRNNQPTPQTPQ